MNSFILSATNLVVLGALILVTDGVILQHNGANLPTLVTKDDCEQSALRHAESCGVIFEKVDCSLSGTWWNRGDELAIEQRNWKNLRGTGFHNDVESIIVAPECVLFGYEKNDQNARGPGISVSAVDKQNWVYRELSDERVSNDHK